MYDVFGEGSNPFDKFLSPNHLEVPDWQDSRQHSVYYPCFTRQEMASLSTLKCLKRRIPLTCC